MKLPANLVVDLDAEGERLSQKVRQYCTHNCELSIYITSKPLPETQACVYVIHESRLSELLAGPDRPVTWLPALCFGPASQLRRCFLAGCADYMKEPWSMQELHCRVISLAERSEQAHFWGPLQLRIGSLVVGTKSVSISMEEHNLLRLLIAQKGKVVPRQALYYTLWGNQGGTSRVVDVHVSAIRKKISDILRDASVDMDEYTIRAARGIGYFIP